MKKTFLKLATILLGIIILQSCGGVNREYKSIPPGEHYKIIYEKVLGSIGTDDPEIYDLSGSFKPGSHESYSGSAYFEITVRSASAKDKLTGYTYSFEAANWSGPDEVTIYTYGDRNKKQNLTYDEYKDVLFKINEMPPFSEFDNMYKKAIEASGFGEGKCYVQSFKMERDEDAENSFYIVVQSKENKNANKTVYFDMKGNVLETIDSADTDSDDDDD